MAIIDEVFTLRTTLDADRILVGQYKLAHVDRILIEEDAVDPVLLPVEPFSTTHPAMQRMLGRLDAGRAFRAQRQGMFPAGLCYWNVLEAIKQHGGKLVLGWMIEWVPEVYIFATHHGVWLSPSNHLIDVTTPQSSKPEIESTTFVPDSRTPFEPAFPMQVTNKYLPLVNDRYVDGAISNYMINNAFYRDLIQRRKDAGYRWSPRKGWEPGLHQNLVDFGSDRPRVVKSFNAIQKNNSHILKRYFQK